MVGKSKVSSVAGELKFSRAAYAPSQIADMMIDTRWADEFEYPQLELLAKHGTTYQVPKEMVIFREGTPGPYMGMILKGGARIVKEDSNQKKKEINVIKSGESFGEMSMIDHEPRSATVVATKDTILILFTEKSLYSLAEENAPLSLQFVLSVARMISKRLRSTSGRLIDHLEA